MVVGFLSIMSVAVGFSLFDESGFSDTPEISDVTITSDSVKINPNKNAADYVTASDSASIELTTENTNYWIDSNGKKHYTINAQDTPSLQN